MIQRGETSISRSLETLQEHNLLSEVFSSEAVKTKKRGSSTSKFPLDKKRVRILKMTRSGDFAFSLSTRVSYSRADDFFSPKLQYNRITVRIMGGAGVGGEGIQSPSVVSFVVRKPSPSPHECYYYYFFTDLTIHMLFNFIHVSIFFVYLLQTASFLSCF